MRIENLIFLGAGASHSEGASIQANLFRDFFITHANINNAKINRIKKNIQNFFNTFFGFDFQLNEKNDKKSPNFLNILNTNKKRSFR